jgi:hypothetical protein
MHPDRLSFLSYNNAQRRAIVSKIRDESGMWNLVLECGHTGNCVAHMNPGADWRCVRCGEQYVRQRPAYAKEFN